MNRRSMIVGMSVAGVAVSAGSVGAKPAFAIGDVVSCHEAGPQLMTISAVTKWGDMIVCDWFDKNTFHRRMYWLEVYNFRKWKPA